MNLASNLSQPEERKSQFTRVFSPIIDFLRSDANVKGYANPVVVHEQYNAK